MPPDACLWALARSLLLSALLVSVAGMLRSALLSAPARVRTIWWVLLLVPFFTPDLLIGYAWRNCDAWLPVPLGLEHHPWGKQALYATLVGMKLLPVATLAMYFAPPPPLSAEALHCRRLLGGTLNGRRYSRLSFSLRGPMQRWLLSFALTFLLAFQEFEIASLLDAKLIDPDGKSVYSAWTVWLLDAQAGGLLLAESFKRLFWPLLFEIALVFPVVVLLLRNRRLPIAPHEQPGKSNVFTSACVWFYLVVAAVLVLVLPGAFLLRSLPAGLPLWWQDFALLREIRHSLLYAVVSAGAAFWAAKWLLRPRCPPAGVLAACLPGLLGALAWGLTLVWLFQRPVLNVAYDKPAALIVGLGGWLIVRAVLLRLVVDALASPEAVHLAHMAASTGTAVQRRAAREIRWSLRGRGQFWTFVILAYWGYLEAMLAGLLEPVRAVPVSRRLYNQMHYGHNDLLSATLFVALAAPVVLILVSIAVLRWGPRLADRRVTP